MSLKTNASDGSVTLGKARLDVCFDAVYELESLAYLLPLVTCNSDEEATKSALVVRGIAGRFVTLTNVLMAALCDEVQPTEKLSKKVNVQPCMGDF